MSPLLHSMAELIRVVDEHAVSGDTPLTLEARNALEVARANLDQAKVGSETSSASKALDLLWEYFRATELFASVSGSESAEVGQERAAEERFERASDAVRALLRAELIAASGVNHG